MSDVQTVLVGIDGSTSGERARAWAEGYAAASGATLRIVTATEAPHVYGTPGPAGLFDVRAEAEKVNKQALANSSLPPGRVEGEVLFGSPREALVEASSGADLLVVGSRGHGTITGLFVGSVSSYCVRHARCPVVVVP